MPDLIITYTSIFLSSMLKFAAGPIIGVAKGLPYYMTALITSLGMMCSVILVAFLGSYTKEYFDKKRRESAKPIKFKKRNRTVIQVWQKFGIFGLSMMTPILLTPIGGTLIAVALGVPRKTIIFHMAYSSILWSFAITLGIAFLRTSFSHIF